MFKRFIPEFHAKSIYDININFYKKLNISLIISDLDNTLDAFNDGAPSLKAIELVKNIRNSGIDFIVISNNTKKRVSKYCDVLNVNYISSAQKPFSYKIKKHIKKLNINPENVIIIGDQTVTDICAGNGAKIHTILTDKLVENDQITTKFNRIFDKRIRKKLKNKGLLREWEDYLDGNN